MAVELFLSWFTQGLHSDGAGGQVESRRFMDTISSNLPHGYTSTVLLCGMRAYVSLTCLLREFITRGLRLWRPVALIAAASAPAKPCWGGR